ncbi:unnamed protein product [Leptidea sinapis]|uniref:Nucleolus and neural progenitor protein-like N-terminal domain-containing protein n=1 Tax=Leptidea sinapis TaxID=189913 RepID=A0A5E4QL50_9NEOP|nr:unnamed protein product [Leptidea sinapis]
MCVLKLKLYLQLAKIILADCMSEQNRSILTKCCNLLKVFEVQWTNALALSLEQLCGTLRFLFRKCCYGTYKLTLERRYACMKKSIHVTK